MTFAIPHDPIIALFETVPAGIVTTTIAQASSKPNSTNYGSYAAIVIIIIIIIVVLYLFSKKRKRWGYKTKKFR